MYTKKEILDMVSEEDIEFIRLQFTDMFGTLKNVAITAAQLEKALDNKFMFDASAIEGFTGAEDPDMYLYPDLDTFVIFPWRPQQGKVARLMCDVYTADGKPFESDSRYILKKVLKEAADLGYKVNVGPKCEFFLFPTDEDGNPSAIMNEKAGYFDLYPLDTGENARRDIVLSLEDMGFDVESSHHESAPSQHEIDFKYGEALETADNMVTFKLAVKSIARRHGLHASFMPKPKYGVPGSGMHVDFSLTKAGKNIFEDALGKDGLSREAYSFIAGIMEHIEAITLVTNPIVNSYKRLASGAEAPSYIAWSLRNRSALIRIPKTKEGGIRVELRNPDPSCNPYLAFALIIAAGLDGIKNNLSCSESVNKNIYEMSKKEREEEGIRTLPTTLKEAVSAFKNDSFVLDVLGEHVRNTYVSYKSDEWERYTTRVTKWEMDEYLYRI